MRIGGEILNPPEDPGELARTHVNFGYNAAYCPNLELSNKKHINEIRKAFLKENVIIAEVGAWCNLISPDDDKRKKNFNLACERLSLADEIGARCCVDYIGTLDPNFGLWPHPNNFLSETFVLAVDVIRRIIDEVKPKNTRFAIEMMPWIVPDSADCYLKLIHAVDRPSFGVHMDPVNIIVSPRLYYNNGTLIHECFKKLGKWIVSCHAKDIIARNTLPLHLDEGMPGTGNLDYRTYLSELNRLPGEVPLMLEHLKSQEEYATALKFLRSAEKELDIK